MKRRIATGRRTCQHCGEVYDRNRGEPVDKYAERKFCDRHCRDRARRTEAARAAEAAPRVCALDECDTVLVRGERERPGEYAARRYCSPRCRTVGGARRKRAPGPGVGEGDGRCCALDGCVEQLVRRDGERPGQYATRKHCSTGCAHAARAGVPGGTNAARTRSRAQARGALAVVEVPAQPWRPAAWRDPAGARGEARDPRELERVEAIRRVSSSPFRRPSRRVLAST